MRRASTVTGWSGERVCCASASAASRQLRRSVEVPGFVLDERAGTPQRHEGDRIRPRLCCFSYARWAASTSSDQSRTRTRMSGAASTVGSTPRGTSASARRQLSIAGSTSPRKPCHSASAASSRASKTCVRAVRSLPRVEPDAARSRMPGSCRSSRARWRSPGCDPGRGHRDVVGELVEPRAEIFARRGEPPCEELRVQDLERMLDVIPAHEMLDRGVKSPRSSYQRAARRCRALTRSRSIARSSARSRSRNSWWYR